MVEIKKSYRNNNALRQSFNELAKCTFCLDFEDWYQNGLWTDRYNPYSVVKDGEVIANVSVNQTDLIFDGNIKHFLQLGTVMTKEGFRKQGLIREIMAAIDADYNGKTDGTYLFANDSVLDFYPKFGFLEAFEYLYSKSFSNRGECYFEKTPMYNKKSWESLKSAMERSIFRGRLDLAGNPELILFYVTKFMQEDVYYHKDSDTYVIAEFDNGNIFLHNIFSSTLRHLNEIIPLFGESAKKVVLGFVPETEENFRAEKIHPEDCTFFLSGKGTNIFQSNKLRIPSLAHA
ncbi:MAG: GNAT family N-acetyltransferase [Lachnospiraceae bacterium]|nr:GNAT family N-acetyltransferase [Lachnospiraceae bacterium]